jgi:asparagine synthase (glutamine-hydrolysing)
MAGIAGILKEGQHDVVSRMIDLLAHRGNYRKTIIEKDGATIGMGWSIHEDEGMKERLQNGIFRDGPGFGHKLEVAKPNGKWEISRDELGVAPMYFASNCVGDFCFASEVKALLRFSKEIFEVPSGHKITESGVKPYFSLETKPLIQKDPEIIAIDLLNILTSTVTRRISSDYVGISLTGGLNSSTIAILVRPWVKTLHTFTGGLSNAPEFEYASEMARHLDSIHHEIIIDLEMALEVLPMVIYHLESFDVDMVRSGIINYLVSEEASEYVYDIFSGTGGDELFAGFEYLKSIPEPSLNFELLKILSRMHNTVLQCIDRSTAAHGLTSKLVFADPDLVEFVLGIPANLKLKNGTDKWILRKAMEGVLPKVVLIQQKNKIREDSRLGSLISDYVSTRISNPDFKAERVLKNGWKLSTKEELFYYRFFREFFGENINLDWMGRINGMPKQ